MTGEKVICAWSLVELGGVSAHACTLAQRASGGAMGGAACGYACACADAWAHARARKVTSADACA
eukprot:6188785-Pleurochrysis_carterae.AAC.2